MKKLLVILPLALFFLLPACNKMQQPRSQSDLAHNKGPAVQMERNQTQCADAWGYGSTHEETITKLKSYLLQKKITVTTAEIVANPPAPMCLACICGNGNVFKVSVLNQYIQSMLAQGFQVVK